MIDAKVTVAIVYGWAEGPWHATRFARECAANGLTVIADATSADIIFAHSSGCYQIPKDAKARLILLAGLPYRPLPLLALGVVRKVGDEYMYHRRKKELGWWLDKLLHNGWYMVARPRATFDLLTKHRAGNLPSSEDKEVLVVRAKGDMFVPADIATILDKRGYGFIEIEGSHDGCWVEPGPYVNLVRRDWRAETPEDA